MDIRNRYKKPGIELPFIYMCFRFFIWILRLKIPFDYAIVGGYEIRSFQYANLLDRLVCIA